MAVNTRTEYALRALLEIADSPKEAVSAQKICDHQALPKKYIERLLGNLKAAGLIESCSGAKGGYNLAKPADQISLKQVLLAVDDDSLDPTCSSGSSRFCPGGDCALRAFFTKLGDKMSEMLSEYTLADIYGSWKGAKA